MPNGKTHDAITFLTAVPVFAGGYVVTRSLSAACIVTAAYLFGGLMFGPDLDTASVQHTRWSVFRSIWAPYRMFFNHRSRFSHGLVFGALIRVIYFLGVITLLAFGAAIIVTAVTGGRVPELFDLARTWQRVGEYTRSHFGPDFLLLVFLGLWLGAAGHTFTDMAGSFIKTGRLAKFL